LGAAIQLASAFLDPRGDILQAPATFRLAPLVCKDLFGGASAAGDRQVNVSRPNAIAIAHVHVASAPFSLHT
jgi:hypothetical protein